MFPFMQVRNSAFFFFFTLGEATKFHVEVFFQAEDGSHSPSEIKFVAEGFFFWYIINNAGGIRNGDNRLTDKIGAFLLWQQLR